jgi:glycoprotein 6-alpha-L-fucosyltransferase
MIKSTKNIIHQTFSFIFRVHVRRTDKVGTEASFHALREYMVHVKDYYDVLDLQKGKRVKRTVYLASDEPAVLREAKAK